MPAKRKVQKRRLDPRGEAEAWAGLFDSGYDFFGDLRSYGVALDDYDRADPETSVEAWHRLGPIFLAARPPQARPSWAERKFGAPRAG